MFWMMAVEQKLNNPCHGNIILTGIVLINLLTTIISSIHSVYLYSVCHHCVRNAAIYKVFNGGLQLVSKYPSTIEIHVSCKVLFVSCIYPYNKWTSKLHEEAISIEEDDI